MVKTGSSYLSQSELPVTFGLGQADSVTSIEIRWPNGQSERLAGTAANRWLTIVEAKGITSSTPLNAGTRP
jgi:hypothetical protein